MAFLPAALVTAGIAILSLMESTYVPQALSTQDKLIHGAMYAVLAFSWMWPVARRSVSQWMPYLYVWIAVTGYGAVMEALQRFCTLTRSGEMADLYADAIGAFLGVALVAIIRILNHKS